jgi:chaperonin GroES
MATSIQASQSFPHGQLFKRSMAGGVGLEAACAADEEGRQLRLEASAARRANNNERRSIAMNLQPLGDRLIVELLEEEEMTISGIVLPDTAREKPQRGKVLAVGPGSRNDKGELVPMEVAVGDEIVFSKYGGTEVKVGLEDLLILRESDVLAKAVAAKSKKDKSQLAGATA